MRGIFVYRTGEPFNITAGADNNDGSVANDFPALINNANLSAIYNNNGSERTQYLIARTDALNILGTPTDVRNPFDNIGRNRLRSPRVTFYDLSLVKRFHFTERANLALEINVFNIFNTVNFAAPVSVLSSATFGQVTALRNGMNPHQIQPGIKFNF